MNKLDLGAVSAYAMAKEKGYQGTEEEFATLMAEAGNNALRAEAAKNRAEEILESIPQDYATLSQNVVKNAGNITALTEEITDVVSDLYTKSDNLFDFSAVRANELPRLDIGSRDTEFVAYNGYYTSNYIPVVGGEQYCVIYDSSVTMRQFVVAYYSNGVLIAKHNPAANPFTVPDGADHMYIIDTNSGAAFGERSTSVKKYSASMDMAWHPYGKTNNFLNGNAFNESGLYKQGANIYHFVRFGDKHLIRRFKREGPNNLFQFSALYIGSVSDDGVSISETIVTNGTDIVGPMSVMRSGIDSIGEWAGGYHDIGVGGVRYATAEQESLTVTINGEPVTADGLYYGTAHIVAVNKLYFPQTVQGADLSTATMFVREKRHYILDTAMNVQVTLDFVADTRVICYYGLQAVRRGFSKIVLPDDEKTLVFGELTSDYLIQNPHHKAILESDKLIYEITLGEVGLGSFTHNSNADGYKHGSIPKNVGKYYQMLIAGDYDHAFISAGKTLYWEGCYNIYFK